MALTNFICLCLSLLCPAYSTDISESNQQIFLVFGLRSHLSLYTPLGFPMCSCVLKIDYNSKDKSLEMHCILSNRGTMRYTFIGFQKALLIGQMDKRLDTIAIMFSVGSLLLLQ